MGIEELLGGTLHPFVPVACHGSFQLEPFEGQGRTQEVSGKLLETSGVTCRHRVFEPLCERP